MGKLRVTRKVEKVEVKKESKEVKKVLGAKVGKVVSPTGIVGDGCKVAPEVK